MKTSKETIAYWEERSKTILEAYKKGLISKEDPVQEAQIEWAQLSNQEKEKGVKNIQPAIDRWESETDAMAESEE